MPKCSSNKYGLFELLQKGPVAVALGLDPEYFQFYQNDRENSLYFDTTFWRPSVYGVVVEFNQFSNTDSNDYSKYPFFTIVTLVMLPSFDFVFLCHDSA